MQKKILAPVVCSVLFLVSWGWAEDNHIQERISATFFPYSLGPLQEDGITPGMKIDKTNFQVATGVLPSAILKLLEAGDFALSVQETTNLPLRQEYIEATQQHYGKASIGAVELQNYVAGLPFPVIDVQDPQAGLKVAWNYRYRDRGETVQYWPTNELRNSSGTVERSESFYVVFMFGTRRPDPEKNLPAWERSGVYTKRYMRVLAPADAEGRQILSLTYENDSLLDDQWAYDPRTRRTRKVVYNPYESPGGGELLMEDTSGFNGYIHTYEWKYLGEQVVLAPGPIRTAEPTLSGKGNWYPTDPWELRKAMVVEATPKGSHPVYGKRVMYLDLQTYANLYTLAYDREGNHKRTFFQVYFHPEFNPWGNEVWIPQLSAQLSIDHQRERASIFQTHRVLYNKPLNENRWFGVMALMLYGK
jgi:hypothetical protein